MFRKGIAESAGVHKHLRRIPQLFATETIGPGIFSECIRCISNYAAGLNGNRFELFTILKRLFTDFFQRQRKRYAMQTLAPVKRPTPDACDADRDRDALQARAVVKRRFPDARQSLGQGDAVQARTPVKRLFPDSRHTVGQGNAVQAQTPAKRLIPDARHTIGNGHDRVFSFVFFQYAVFDHKIIRVVHYIFLRCYISCSPSQNVTVLLRSPARRGAPAMRLRRFYCINSILFP